ncbi:MAG: hypothetical protein ABI593_05485 [Betaproteobacteria bacterium]
MNGLTLLVMLAVAIGIVVAWRAGVMRGRREAKGETKSPLRPAAVMVAASPSGPPVDSTPPRDCPSVAGGALEEQARLVRALEAETALLRSSAATAAAERAQLAESADDRRLLLHELAAARADTARYRDIVVDIENNAMPPLLDGPNAPDDLKLIVGVGPVLERMLHQLGVTTYRQIARWSERDIDHFDAKLPEFPGRIRRDAWVTQARELHLSKFGETLPIRER